MSTNAPKIAAVILAAGEATRFGSPKQLALIDGESLILRAVRAASSADVADVFVVVGSHANEVASVVQHVDRVIVVRNDEWRDGLASSLRAGLRAAREHGADAALVTTADQPLVDGSMLRRLFDSFTAGTRIVAARYGDALGVPALIGMEHCDALADSISGDSGAGRWLRARSDVVAVDMPLAAFDVDTVESLQTLPRPVID